MIRSHESQRGYREIYAVRAWLWGLGQDQYLSFEAQEEAIAVYYRLRRVWEPSPAGRPDDRRRVGRAVRLARRILRQGAI